MINVKISMKECGFKGYNHQQLKYLPEGTE
jgi:hypothetical protein